MKTITSAAQPDLSSSSPDAFVEPRQLAGLPGLPKRPEDIAHYARKHGWKHRLRTGQGGGYEYLRSTLQPWVRQALTLREAEGCAGAGVAGGAAELIRGTAAAAAAVNTREIGLAQITALSGARRTKVECRLAVLASFQAYRSGESGTLEAMRKAFVGAWNAVEIPIDAELRARFPEISERTLRRWGDLLEKDGAKALAGNHGNRAGDTIIDRQPKMRGWIVDFIFQFPHAKPKRILDALVATFRDSEFEHVDRSTGEVTLKKARFPRERALRAWIAAYRKKEHAALARNANPDAFRSKYQAAFGSRSEGIVRLNQRLEMDATPIDIVTTDGRCAIIGVIDVYSRRLTLHVSRTSTGVAVGLALRRAILMWGVPEAVKMDNGKDFTSRHVSSVLAALKIECLVCDPFAPDQKPHIERALGTFSHSIVELCQGFIGHSVADRKNIEARKSFGQRQAGAKQIEVRITAARLQEICDQWCEAVYERTQHDGLDGRSPFEVATAWREPVRRIENERALDLLLAEAPGGVTRIVTKRGISVEGRYYIAPVLGGCVGDKVHVRMLDDAGHIVVYTLEADYLCIAECPEVTGVSRAAIAAQASAIQRAAMGESVKLAREAAKRFKSVDIAQIILEDAVSRAGNVVALPSKSTPHTTAALDQAALAARALEQRSVPSEPLNAEQLADLLKLKQEHAEQQEGVRVVELDDEQMRLARYRRLQARAEAGELLADADMEWMTRWKETSEGRVALSWDEDFGGFGQERA